jgi:PHD/YefM family antitoxin component YafN of YafNO toxin-antitoxin module
MSLTDVQIRNAKSREKAYKMYDSGGLYVEIAKSGGKLWRMKYSYAGKEKLLSFGSYPIVSLSDARQKRDEAKRLLSKDADPSDVKRIEKQQRVIISSNNFEAVARDWFDRHLSLKAESTKNRVTRRMERFVFPYVGKRPVAELTSPDILEVVRRVEKNGSIDTAHRVLQEIGQIIRYAIQTGRAVNDPTPALRGALPPIKQNHFASPAEDPVKVGELLRTIDGFKGTLA